MGVLEQVVAPGHADKRFESAERDQEGAALQRAGQDQIGLGAADDAFQVDQQPTSVLEPGRRVPAAPLDDLDLRREGTLLERMSVLFEAQVGGLQICLCER